MREELRNPGRLEHILISIDNIVSFSNGRTAEDFKRDKLLFYAVIKNLEIIGEAAYMLTPSFRDNHQETPWKKIVGLRHILVHDYYQVDADELLNIVNNDLGPLKAQVERYLKESA